MVIHVRVHAHRLAATVEDQRPPSGSERGFRTQFGRPLPDGCTNIQDELGARAAGGAAALAGSVRPAEDAGVVAWTRTTLCSSSGGSSSSSSWSSNGLGLCGLG